MLRNAIAATAILVAATFISPAIAGNDNPMPRTISLSGHGEVRVVPDTAIVTAGVLSQADTAAAALAANTTAMNAVFAALKAAGIDASDTQTSNFSVQPRYDFDNTSRPRFVGYDVSNTVTVTVRNLTTLGSVLDAVVTAGSNQIQGVTFQVSKPDAFLDEARKLAVADAVRKAKVYAEASGTSIGAVISIAEGAALQPPVALQAKVAMAERSSDVPIAGGEQALTVDVNMVWEIK